MELDESLFRELAPALLAYFRSRRLLTGSAEDLLQETFVRVLRRPRGLRDAESPRGYLFGIARHVAFDALRRFKPAASLEELAAFPAPCAPRDERIEDLRTAIAALPAIHREPLLLKLRHELSYAEIAVALSLPIGTVRSRLHHAVRNLRKTLVD